MNIYAIINVIKCKPYDFFKDFTFNDELRNIKDFYKMYFLVNEHNKKRRVIKYKKILNKCVQLELKIENKTKVFLTDFLYEREHD